MPASKPTRLPGRRRSTSRRALLASGGASSAALVLLVAHIFAPRVVLEIAALWMIGAALLAAWIAILAWRIPVYGRRRLIAFGAVWGAGIALAVLLVLLSTEGPSLVWTRSVQWLALMLSNTVGALFLRALLRVRASSIAGRLLSLASPIAILALIVILSKT